MNVLINCWAHLNEKKARKSLNVDSGDPKILLT